MTVLQSSIVWFALAAAPAAAVPDVGTVEVAVPLAQSEPSRDRLIEELQRKYNARVVRVDEAQFEGRKVYDVRLLSDARVWTVRVDAATGRELPRD